MYKLLKVKDMVRVSPDKLEYDLEEAVLKSLKETYEGKITANMGVMLCVNDVENIDEGVIYPTDASIHFPVTFNLLTYKPELHEIVEGEVIDIAEFGAFVRMGPLDGLVHISQIMDDYVTYDEKNSQFEGRKSSRVLQEGDHVRARIISISYEKESKIGLTMRQPGLGAMGWIEAEKKRAPAPDASDEGENEE